MFVPQIFDGSVQSVRAPLSEQVRAIRIAQLGLVVVADNRRSLATYDAEKPVATKVHDPLETEAVRLSERIRTEHKRTGTACGDHRSDFEVPDWSSQEVFYRALAILNPEGIRLANFRFGQSAGTMALSFFDAPVERDVWDMLPSDCQPSEYNGS